MSKGANGKLATRAHCDLRMDRGETVAALQEWLAEIDRHSRSVTRAFALVTSDAARATLLNDIGDVAREREGWLGAARSLWEQWVIAQATTAGKQT